MKSSSLHRIAWGLPFLVSVGAALLARSLDAGAPQDASRVGTAIILLGGAIVAAMTTALLLILGRTRRISLALWESEAKFRTAIETMKEGLIVRDRNGAVVVANARSAEIFGLNPEQIAGRQSLPEGWRAFHEDETDMHPSEWPSRIALERGQALKEGTMGFRTLAGEMVWTSFSSVPLFHPGETQAYAVVTTYADITVRKRREERTRRQIERANDANAQLSEANARLLEAAHTDGLTGLCNRRAFEETLAEEVAKSLEEGRPLSLVMIDVDEFKAFNDQFGHLAGDEALRRVGRILAAVCRPEDQPARYGGEEFALLLADADADRATALAERIRGAVEAAPWEHRAITVSLGVAILREGDGRALVAEADAALYAAKGGGRNQVRHASRSSPDLRGCNLPPCSAPVPHPPVSSFANSGKRACSCPACTTGSPPSPRTRRARRRSTLPARG